MNKVVRDGKVAVLVSPGFGSGWYSWNSWHGEAAKGLLFHPTLVKMVEDGNRNSISVELLEELIGIDHMYDGGKTDLGIVWVPEGLRFRINEYDGFESLVLVSDDNWITA